MIAGSICPSCGSSKTEIFYEVKQVPVHSVLLMPTREIALNYPKSDLDIAFCDSCGFIYNQAYNPELQEYSTCCEESQGYSPTFRAFQKDLVERLVSRYDLHNKELIEIGCGKGEFLTLLCEIGPNRGVGFDPAYVDDWHESEAKERIKFIKDFYSEKYVNYQGDFIACKMTLEHINETDRIINVVRRSIGERQDTAVFFQIPNVDYILRDMAFWDIYYEHCSYFSAGSLSRLFRRNGFEVIDVWIGYADQYLMIEAKPGVFPAEFTPNAEDATELERLRQAVASFRQRIPGTLARWEKGLAEFRQDNKRVVLWGSGSKAVTFLNTFKHLDHGIEYAVDINPHRHHTFLAGTGQEIISPEFLQEYQPDVVIIMNPIYREEIQRDLTRLGLDPQVITL